MKKDNTQWELVRICPNGDKIYREVCGIEKKRRNLIEFYDAMNDAARTLEQNGIDTSKWFYTPEQLEEAVKNGELVAL